MVPGHAWDANTDVAIWLLAFANVKARASCLGAQSSELKLSKP